MSFVEVGVRDDALVAYVDRGGLAHHDELAYGTADRRLTPSGKCSSCSRTG